MNVQGCIIRFKIKCLQSRLPIVQLDKLQLSFGTIYIKKNTSNRNTVLQMVKDEMVKKKQKIKNNKRALGANEQNSNDSGSYDFNIISWQPNPL